MNTVIVPTSENPLFFFFLWTKHCHLFSFIVIHNIPGFWVNTKVFVDSNTIDGVIIRQPVTAGKIYRNPVLPRTLSTEGLSCCRCSPVFRFQKPSPHWTHKDRTWYQDRGNQRERLAVHLLISPSYRVSSFPATEQDVHTLAYFKQKTSQFLLYCIMRVWKKIVLK